MEHLVEGGACPSAGSAESSVAKTGRGVGVMKGDARRGEAGAGASTPTGGSSQMGLTALDAGHNGYF